MGSLAGPYSKQYFMKHCCLLIYIDIYIYRYIKNNFIDTLIILNMPAFCSTINCVNKRGKNVGNNKSFFRFPKDQNR